MLVPTARAEERPQAADSGDAGPQPAAAGTPAGPLGADWLGAARRAAEALQWTDEQVRHDWRLQHRPGTEAARILDPLDRTVREGPREECLETFAMLERDGRVEAVAGPTVIVLHGLGEGRQSMKPLVDHLRKHLDATVLSFGYASTAAGLEAHGRALADVIAGLPAADSISFVGHSMGNLVVRRWMALAPAPELARVRKMVMLGPPNQGSELARMVAGVSLLAALSEGAARELVLDWNRVAKDLAVPTCPFGIVAGGKGDAHGYSRLLSGDDDAVVRVEETRLPGADDFLLLPVHHAAMMRSPGVQKATLEFLQSGRFEPPGDGQ
jgi:pimeloyl-ACP methyl ester carboxylesterase